MHKLPPPVYDMIESTLYNNNMLGYALLQPNRAFDSLIAHPAVYVQFIGITARFMIELNNAKNHDLRRNYKRA